MATIEQLYEAFANLKIRDDLQEIIRQNGPAMAQLVESQLIQGKLSTGDSITPSYRGKYYSQKKYSLNSTPGYGTPDLKLTGDFYSGIGVAIKSDDEYDIESDVPYAVDLNSMYGDETLALSDDNKQVFCDDTLGPAISKYITDITGLLLT